MKLVISPVNINTVCENARHFMFLNVFFADKSEL